MPCLGIAKILEHVLPKPIVAFLSRRKLKDVPKHLSSTSYVGPWHNFWRNEAGKSLWGIPILIMKARQLRFSCKWGFQCTSSGLKFFHKPSLFAVASMHISMICDSNKYASAHICCHRSCWSAVQWTNGRNLWPARSTVRYSSTPLTSIFGLRLRGKTAHTLQMLARNHVPRTLRPWK